MNDTLRQDQKLQCILKERDIANSFIIRMDTISFTLKGFLLLTISFLYDKNDNTSCYLIYFFTIFLWYFDILSIKEKKSYHQFDMKIKGKIKYIDSCFDFLYDGKSNNTKVNNTSILKLFIHKVSLFYIPIILVFLYLQHSDYLSKVFLYFKKCFIS